MDINNGFKCFDNNKNKYKTVRISNQMINRAREFSLAVSEAKKNESEIIDISLYKLDHDALSNRYLCGILGEMAVFEYLGYSFELAEQNIGLTFAYNHADLSPIGINCGVKSANINYRSVPVINTYNKISQIITMVDIEQRVVYICGYLSAEKLLKYCSPNLIKNEKLRQKGNKQGFWGFEYLKPINLEKYQERKKAA